jgi:hypothetical protein
VFTIELEGGERRQVTENEKFALKAVSLPKCPLETGQDRFHTISVLILDAGWNELLRRNLLARLRPVHRPNCKTSSSHLPQHADPRNKREGPQCKTVKLEYPSQSTDL